VILRANLRTQADCDLEQGSASGQLGQAPCVELSNHPHDASTDDLQNWVGAVLNWIGNSPAGDDTAIFEVWDDRGGFYDHVTRPKTRDDRLGPDHGRGFW